MIPLYIFSNQKLDPKRKFILTGYLKITTKIYAYDIALIYLFKTKLVELNE